MEVGKIRRLQKKVWVGKDRSVEERNMRDLKSQANEKNEVRSEEEKKVFLKSDRHGPKEVVQKGGGDSLKAAYTNVNGLILLILERQIT